MYQTFLKRALVALLLGVGLLAMSNLAFGQGITTPDPTLPPDGVYLSPDDVHAMYGGAALQIVLSKPQHQPFKNEPVHRQDNGADEEETFQSGMKGDVEVFQNGNSVGTAQVTGTGPVTTLVLGKVGNVTGTFDTEMLSMDLSGGTPFGPFMIRESPTKQSTGKTTITDIGGGLFHIDSFFDVFTELSLDGGTSWMPDTSAGASIRMYLVPEPGTFTLMGLSVLGLVGFAWRRRRAA